MIKEVGSCSGIENYSRHLALREEGETPYTLITSLISPLPLDSGNHLSIFCLSEFTCCRYFV